MTRACARIWTRSRSSWTQRLACLCRRVGRREPIRFYVDDELVRTVEQRIDYPLKLMVDLFEFPEGALAIPRVPQAGRGRLGARLPARRPPRGAPAVGPARRARALAFMTEMSSRWLGRPADRGRRPRGAARVPQRRPAATGRPAPRRPPRRGRGRVRGAALHRRRARRGQPRLRRAGGSPPGARPPADGRDRAPRPRARAPRAAPRHALGSRRVAPPLRAVGYREVPRFGENPYAAHWFAKRLS